MLVALAVGRDADRRGASTRQVGVQSNECYTLRRVLAPNSKVRAFLPVARLLVSYTTLARRFAREGFCARITALQVAS